MFGTWPPPGIVQSSTAPPGRQPDQRVTVDSSGDARVGDPRVDVDAFRRRVRRRRTAVVRRPRVGAGLGTWVGRHRRAAPDPLERAAVVMDDVVRGPLDLEDRDWRARRAVGRVREGLAGETDKGGDPIPVGAPHPVAHEPAVRVADEVDSLRIDGTLSLDLGNQTVEVGDIVDAGPVEVAARVGCAPEAVAELVLRAIGSGEEEASLGRRVAKMEVRVLLRAGRAVAMEQDDQWSRSARVVARRNVDRHGPIATDDDVGDAGDRRRWGGRWGAGG